MPAPIFDLIRDLLFPQTKLSFFLPLMPSYSSEELIHGIVQECHSQFKRLPKHGKPVRKSNGQAEWTILAGIVLATPVPPPPLTTCAQESQADHDGDYGVDSSDHEPDVFWELECISLA